MTPNDQRRVLTLRPIGIIHTPFRGPAGTPIQAAYGEDAEGEVVVDKELEPALADIDGFERLWLIYWFDRTARYELRVIPYRDTRKHGLFATRAPSRPNPIGLSVTRLRRREGTVLYVRGLDILDGTPLLDIKPYVPEFDAYPLSRAGWLDESRAKRRVADKRFHGRTSRR